MDTNLKWFAFVEFEVLTAVNLTVLVMMLCRPVCRYCVRELHHHFQGWSPEDGSMKYVSPKHWYLLTGYDTLKLITQSFISYICMCGNSSLFHTLVLQIQCSFNHLVLQFHVIHCPFIDEYHVWWEKCYMKSSLGCCKPLVNFRLIIWAVCYWHINYQIIEKTHHHQNTGTPC